MNRKEGAIVGLVLLVSFVGGAFAAPAIQNTFITNDPLNVRIVGGTSTPQTSSVDIELFRVVPSFQGCCNGGAIISTSGNRMSMAFSFAPRQEFSGVNSVSLSVLHMVSGGDMVHNGVGVRVNNGLLSILTLESVPMSGTLASQDLRVGSNTIDIGVNEISPNTSGLTVIIYEIRLAVEYAFLG